MENTSFEIAKVKESEREAIDFVLIAWERK